MNFCIRYRKISTPQQPGNAPVRLASLNPPHSLKVGRLIASAGERPGAISKL